MHRRIVISVCAAFLLTLFCSASLFAQAQPIKLKFSTFWQAPQTTCKLEVQWANEVEKRTNGRVKITVFPGGTLTQADKCYDGTVTGISDIGSAALGYTRGRFPVMEVADLPLGYKSGYSATRLMNAIYRKFKPKELDETKPMYFFGHGPGIVHTKTPVYKLEDLKGMKIRSSGNVAKITAALGAVPVAMPQPETYDALAKGIVQGLMGPIMAIHEWNFGELVNYSTQNFGSAHSLCFFVVMNKEKWNALPPDIQKIIEQLNEEWIDKMGKGYDEMDRVAIEALTKKGHKMIKISKEEDDRWIKAVAKVQDEYVTSMQAKGIFGAEVLKFSREEIKKYQ